MKINSLNIYHLNHHFVSICYFIGRLGVTKKVTQKIMNNLQTLEAGENRNAYAKRAFSIYTEAIPLSRYRRPLRGRP